MKKLFLLNLSALLLISNAVYANDFTSSLEKEITEPTITTSSAHNKYATYYIDVYTHN